MPPATLRFWGRAGHKTEKKPKFKIYIFFSFYFFQITRPLLQTREEAALLAAMPRDLNGGRTSSNASLLFLFFVWDIVTFHQEECVISVEHLGASNLNLYWWLNLLWKKHRSPGMTCACARAQTHSLRVRRRSMGHRENPQNPPSF